MTTSRTTDEGADPTGRASLVGRLHALIDELRARRVPISLVERIDAMRAVERVALDTPDGLHIALCATLIKNAEHRKVFDEVFDLYLRLADRPLPPTVSGDDPAPDVDPEDADPADLRGQDLEPLLRSVLRDGSDVMSGLLAEEAVRRYARFDRGRAAAGIFYEKWTVEGLRLAELSRDVAGEVGAGGSGRGQGSSGSGAGAGSDGVQEVAENAAAVRLHIRRVIREMLVADRGVDAVAKTLRKPLASDVDITMADAAQLAEIQRMLGPLQRKLATTVRRRRRRRVGPLDVRATLRASMATGGVPVRVVHRRPVPTRPQLFVLADMSGSVATFAAFTIALVTGMSELFSRLRTFAFIQNAVEVTDLVRRGQDAAATIRAIDAGSGGRAGTDVLGTSTDYGRSLVQFWNEVAPQLGHRSTVLVFGDGRGNYRPSQESTLALIARRAGALYWLNPEPSGQWGTGDSSMPAYRRHCTEAVSCRTLDDLRHFIERLT